MKMRDDVIGWIYYRRYHYKSSMGETLAAWEKMVGVYSPLIDANFKKGVDFLERYMVK